MKHILLLVIALFYSTVSFSQVDFKFFYSWASLFTKAESENKNIYVFVESSKCTTCDQVKDLFNDVEVADYFNSNFVNIAIDIDKPGMGYDLYNRYEIYGLPASFFLTPKGEVLHKHIQFNSTEELLKIGKAALDPNRQFISLEKKYKSGNASDIETLNYLEALYNTGDRKSDGVLQSYLDGKDLTSPVNRRLIFKYSYPSKNSIYFSYIIKYRHEFVELFDEDDVMFKIFQAIYNDSKFEKIDPLDKQAFKDFYYSYINPAIIPSQDIDNMYLDKLIDQRHSMDKEFLISEAKRVLEGLPEYGWGPYNDIAWVFNELKVSKKDAEIALIWINKSIESEINVYNLETKAQILYSLGRYKEALNFSERVLSLSKQKGSEYDVNAKAARDLIGKIKSENTP